MHRDTDCTDKRIDMHGAIARYLQNIYRMATKFSLLSFLTSK